MDLDLDNDQDYVDELPAAPRKDIAPEDLELLQLAAGAIGAMFEEVDGEGYGNLHFEDGTIVHSWNPLQFSGDALDLAVKLMISIWRRAPDEKYVDAHAVNADYGSFEPLAPDPYVATRRAIVRAAACKDDKVG